MPAARTRRHLEIIGERLEDFPSRREAWNERIHPDDKERIDDISDYDTSWGAPGVGRFRVNILKQRGSYGIVLRTINTEIPNFEQLQLPTVLRDAFTGHDEVRVSFALEPGYADVGVHGAPSGRSRRQAGNVSSSSMRTKSRSSNDQLEEPAITPPPRGGAARPRAVRAPAQRHRGFGTGRPKR